MNFPGGKRFAFSIVDDTDYSFIENIKPVYEFLKENNIRTTKTVWVYPSRNRFQGFCLEDKEYLEFVRGLSGNGYEIALHNAGSGEYKREEIINGMERFNELMGFYPRMQINHSDNKDNIYWGEKRFAGLFSFLYRKYRKRVKSLGDEENSEYFWGDIVKEKIKYIRNFTFNGINTYKYDPRMPSACRGKIKCSNYWFSASDGFDVTEFNNLVSRQNIDRLEREGGICIVYTHFAYGFVNNEGSLNSEFEENMRYLSGKNGWFVPAGTILDYLLKQKGNSDKPLGRAYQFWLSMKWYINRIFKRVKYGR